MADMDELKDEIEDVEMGVEMEGGVEPTNVVDDGMETEGVTAAPRSSKQM